MFGYKLLFDLKRGHCLKFAVFVMEHVGPGSSAFCLIHAVCVWNIGPGVMRPAKQRFFMTCLIACRKMPVSNLNYSNTNTTFIHFIG
jgi:hypothetical protein